MPKCFSCGVEWRKVNSTTYFCPLNGRHMNVSDMCADLPCVFYSKPREGMMHSIQEDKVHCLLCGGNFPDMKCYSTHSVECLKKNLVKKHE